MAIQIPEAPAQVPFSDPTNGHTSASMKKHLSNPANGGIIFKGKIITDPKDVPADDEIKAHRAEVAASHKR